MRHATIAILATLIAAPALAQQPKIPDSYALTLSPQEVDVVWAIVSEKPFKDVAGLLQKIREQVAAQQQPKPAASGASDIGNQTGK